MSRAVLILAGGKGRRFQSESKVWEDKALAEISGKPLLIYAIENVRPVADEIVICVDSETRKVRYTQIIESYGLADARIVIDERGWSIRGPNVAILSGLKACQADYCLTLPCDMPFLEPKVANYLFEEAGEFDVTVPMWPNGRLETLMMILQREKALEIVETLCQLRRSHSDDITRGSSKILLISPVDRIRTLDPELKSFININTKNDLQKMQTRTIRGTIRKNLKLCMGNPAVAGLQHLRQAAKMLEIGETEAVSEAENKFASCTRSFERTQSFFWAALSAQNQGETMTNKSAQLFSSEPSTSKIREAFLRAANNYQLETHFFEQNNCRWLAQRAAIDKTWCESMAVCQTDQKGRRMKTTSN